MVRLSFAAAAKSPLDKRFNGMGTQSVSSTNAPPVTISAQKEAHAQAAAGAQEWHTTVTSELGRADDCFVALSGLSKARVKEAMAKGAAWITRGRQTQRLRRASRRPRHGDELHLYVNPAVLTSSVPSPTLVCDLGDYSVWDKSVGMLSQGSKWGDHCTLGRHVELQLVPERNAFIVHRLDRAASGLMLMAHGKRAANALATLFRSRHVDKRYAVRVHGQIAAPTDQPLPIDAPLNDKQARSVVRVVKVDVERDETLLEVAIETGRKHQIRQHLAGLGHPVVGDRLYGTQDATQDLQLRAVYLSFDCPVTGEAVEYQVSGLEDQSPNG